MMVNKKNMSVNKLEVGMRLAEDVRGNGQVLISKGVTITEAAIRRLEDSYFINEVEVYSEEDTYSDDEVKQVKNIQEVDKIFNELSFDAEQIFIGMENLKVSDIEEVKKFARKIQFELESVSSVVKNIVLHGSGNDTIYRHCVNVSALSSILGKWIGLSDNEINLLLYSAILHDFGKTKIDKKILDKPGTLTTKEFNIMRSHPVIGYNYIKEIPFLNKAVGYAVLTHHEREDGSGYPLGLKGENIHIFSKIIAIADVFDAVNSDRVYQQRKAPFEALEIIRKDSMGKLDYEYCNIFLNHISNYYMGERVLLNSGEICKIVKIDINDIARPLLLVNGEFLDLKEHKELYVKKMIF
ncbi:HD-GYP domain-containing protein (c-di-GMP phosphodiesterase class II) [Clostridium punense]|uniref:HD-GYP domain-containing protein (C-di-GMP phosphodiesterase class II) n=1 Tax=Clostridium punense TaxID=1054297 RepID=A0ABS4K623_9CLOT|nr:MULTISPECIES: HD-GYP domain-containing protein [Clostridium]EQB85972.1 hypothetical protein M918_16745 [Clostridium sp. BL8]MBP2023231.1 HD-GYP domain-containing protein (c-di-GMP phosphodiesterase class II) [Clostridium punense]